MSLSWLLLGALAVAVLANPELLCTPEALADNPAAQAECAAFAQQYAPPAPQRRRARRWQRENNDAQARYRQASSEYALRAEHGLTSSPDVAAPTPPQVAREAPWREAAFYGPAAAAPWGRPSQTLSRAPAPSRVSSGIEAPYEAPTRQVRQFFREPADATFVSAVPSEARHRPYGTQLAPRRAAPVNRPSSSLSSSSYSSSSASFVPPAAGAAAARAREGPTAAPDALGEAMVVGAHMARTAYESALANSVPRGAPRVPGPAPRVPGSAPRLPGPARGGARAGFSGALSVLSSAGGGAAALQVAQGLRALRDGDSGTAGAALGDVVAGGAQLAQSAYASSGAFARVADRMPALGRALGSAKVGGMLSALPAVTSLAGDAWAAARATGTERAARVNRLYVTGGETAATAGTTALSTLGGPIGAAVAGGIGLGEAVFNSVLAVPGSSSSIVSGGFLFLRPPF